MVFKKQRQYRNKYITGKVICGDAIDVLRSIKSETAAVVFLDPPFNLGKKYSENDLKIDSKPKKEYIAWIKTIIEESARILISGGTLYMYHIPIWAMRFGTIIEQYLDFKHWIAISMKNGFVRGINLYPAHYSLLMFTKGIPKFFTRPKIKPKICRHCKKYIKDYGGYLSIIESKGINLSDYWDDIYPVRHSNKKNRNANELSELLLDRIIEISGKEDQLYVDPFAGAGTGVIAAIRKKMKFICCDIVEANTDIICNRISKIHRKLKRENKS